MKKSILFLLVATLLGGFGFLYYMYNEIRFDADKLIYYEPLLTTEIYDRNGVKIANLFDGEHRKYASLKDIPVAVVEALLAIEDTMFFEHKGINYEAIFRAIIKDIKAQKLVEGASTITQQLVKNVLLTREKKFSRKIKEVLLAIRLESILTKEQILERYLNHVYFGHGYYGIRTASEGYFHKSLAQLSIKEIAILVGLPKAPSFYAPTKNYELSLGRANRVLARMYQLGWIDESKYSSALEEEPIVFNETRTRNRAPYIVDEVIKRLTPLFPDLKRGGYRVDTTIDIHMQEAGREAMRIAYEEAVERAKKSEEMSEEQIAQLNGALVAMESKSGNILAMVGGVDYKKSSFNRVTQSIRQPGSSIKPLIYLIGVNSGMSGATKIPDIARTYDYEKDGEEMKWQPKNYEKNYKGLITLREALVHSRNLATINLVNNMGIKRVHKELKRYGIKDVPYNLSVALGNMGVSPFEMSRHYSILSNSGTRVEPMLIQSVTSSSGLTQRYENIEEEIALPKQVFLVLDMMRDVVSRGTGRRAKVKGIEIAGKTGTTNNNVDGWFCGFSPTIQTIVWFGNDDNTPMRKYATGGRISGPAFSRFYSKVLELEPQIKREFDVPQDVISSVIGGKKEYFTDISQPPSAQMQKEIGESLMF